MNQSRVFISYSHKDKEWLQRLQAQLGVLRQEGLVAPWSDENLQPGDDWPGEIRAALDGSDIAVLLVSANFLSSKFIMEKEMPVLLERKQAGSLRRILPLVVTPCAWQLDQNLKNIEVRPKGRAVAQGNQAEQDADLAEVTTEIAKVLVEPALRGKNGQAPSISEAREQACETPPSLRSSRIFAGRGTISTSGCPRQCLRRARHRYGRAPCQPTHAAHAQDDARSLRPGDEPTGGRGRKHRRRVGPRANL